ncbi:MAG: ABC transporter substrate-binding protein [Anaerovoracaceae bacterium]
MKTKLGKKVIAIIMCLSLLFTFCACGGSSDDDVMNLGFITYLGGDQAYVGQAAKLALEDYVAELNENGGLLGKQIKVVTYDYSKDPSTESVNATNKLIQQDNAFAILGPSGSQAAMPMIPLANEAEVPVIATSATNVAVTVDTTTNEVYPYMFRVCFIDEYQGRALGSFAATKANIKKVAILAAIGDPYTEALSAMFTDAFTENGGEIVAKLNYQLNDVEFRAQLTEAGKAGAEALLVPATYYKDVVLMAQQAEDLGLNFKFLIGDGVYSEELLEIAGKQLEGSYMTSGVSDDDPVLAAYNKEFAEKHPGQSANVYVAYTLDAMKLLEHAVNEAGSFEGPAIKEALENAKNVKLFADDNFSMEKDTHNPHNKTVAILKISDSKYNLLEKYQPQD